MLFPESVSISFSTICLASSMFRTCRKGISGSGVKRSTTTTQSTTACEKLPCSQPNFFSRYRSTLKAQTYYILRHHHRRLPQTLRFSDSKCPPHLRYPPQRQYLRWSQSLWTLPRRNFPLHARTRQHLSLVTTAIWKCFHLPATDLKWFWPKLCSTPQSSNFFLQLIFLNV